MSALSLNFRGQPRNFVYPDSGNMSAQVAAILSGRTYPLPRLGPGHEPEVIVDIGANVGASAVWFLAANPEARVVCFEPSPSNVEALRLNLSGFPNVEVCPWGLHNESRPASLYRGASQCMQNSVVRSIETSRDFEAVELRSAAAEFDRLSLDRVSVLKIDTEGCEVPILNDLEQRLGAIEQVYVEYHSEEDRREIDRILKAFVLVLAQARIAHRGVNLYVARTIAESLPQWRALRIGNQAGSGGFA